MAEETSLPISQSSKGTSFIKSCYNACGSFLGVGILTLPYALSQGGWLSLILFFIIALMSCCTTILLKRCMQASKTISSYQDIGEHAFGKVGRVIAYLVTNTELYLLAMGLLIMEGDNLHKLFPGFNLKLGNLAIDGRQSFIIITSFVILPSVLFTSLEKISYFSAVSMLATTLLVISVLCVGVFGRVGFHENGRLLSLKGIPISIGLYTLSFGGHSVIPTVYISMQKKDQFNKVMLVSFILTGILYITMGTIGYIMYGGNAATQITLNLPSKGLSSKLAVYATLTIPVSRYALVMIPVASTIENSPVLQNYSKNKSIKLLINVLLLISTTFTACLVPYFETLMAIAGSMFIVLISFLLPCCCYLKITGTYKKWSNELVGIAFILLFGCFSGVIGTYASIKELYYEM